MRNTSFEMIDQYVNKIICGDCLEVMKEFPDNSVDLVLCDLPYGSTQNKWDKQLPLKQMWKAYKRIIKSTGAITLTATQPFVTDLINSNRPYFRYDLIWYKPLGTGHLNCNRMPMRNHEHILLFYDKLPIYNPQMATGRKRTKGSDKGSTTTNYGKFKGVTSYNDTYYPQSVMEFSNGDRTTENDHPTQKPLSLMGYLILTYTNKNALVLDNCVGSGTTCVAAKMLGRRYIGIDISEEYCEIARKRLLAVDTGVPVKEQNIGQMALFEGEAK